MIRVEVKVTEGVHEIAHLQPGDLGHHVGQERIAGDVEGHTQEQIGTALVQLTTELPLADVELEERVARRQRHGIHFGGIPGADDEPAAVRVLANLGDHLIDLMNRTAVGTPPIGPLGTVHAPQITIRIGPLVPNAHPVLLQPAHVGVAPEEPEQLVGDTLEVDLLGRDQRKPLRQPEARLRPEDRIRARAGSVRLEGSLIENQPEQVVIGAHGLKESAGSLESGPFSPGCSPSPKRPRHPGSRR